MNRFWEELDEKDLEKLEEPLNPDMKYEGSQGIWNKFEAKCKNVDQEGVKVVMPHGKKKKRKLVLVLAAVLVLVCGVGVAASYGTWHLTNPGTYEGDSVKKQGKSSYVWDENKQTYVNENQVLENSETDENETLENSEIDENEALENSEIDETDSSKDKLSDQYFLEKTQEILEIIGKEKIDTSKMQLVYQKDEMWNRKEVMVSFPLSHNDNASTITFDGATGNFLAATIWGNESEADGPLMSDKEALEAARSWYEKLPYPQGYVYTNVSKYDDHCWSYDFCHEVEVEINGEKISVMNTYEDARISIDPTNGQLTLCNLFDVPLLDDHKEGDKPLTEAQAREIADRMIKNPEKTKITAELEIVHPSYGMVFGLQEQEGSEEGADGEDEVVYMDETAFVNNYRYDQVTRLAWNITYERPDEMFTDIAYVSVDLYTGEILTRDMTK